MDDTTSAMAHLAVEDGASTSAATTEAEVAPGRCCAGCKKPEGVVKLMVCAKCRSTSYCSRDCQKADWKDHKKSCGKGPEASTTSNNSDAGTAISPPKGLDEPITKPFTRLETSTYLHNRPENDVFRLLIDTYRMRMADMNKCDVDADEDSIYGDAANGEQGFRRFVNTAKARRDILPPWWSPAKTNAAIAFSRMSSSYQVSALPLLSVC